MGEQTLAHPRSGDPWDLGVGRSDPSWDRITDRRSGFHRRRWTSVRDYVGPCRSDLASPSARPVMAVNNSNATGQPTEGEGGNMSVLNPTKLVTSLRELRDYSEMRAQQDRVRSVLTDALDNIRHGIDLSQGAIRANWADLADRGWTIRPPIWESEGELEKWTLGFPKDILMTREQIILWSYILRGLVIQLHDDDGTTKLSWEYRAEAEILLLGLTSLADHYPETQLGAILRGIAVITGEDGAADEISATAWLRDHVWPTIQGGMWAKVPPQSPLDGDAMIRVEYGSFLPKGMELSWITELYWVPTRLTVLPLLHYLWYAELIEQGELRGTHVGTWKEFEKCGEWLGAPFPDIYLRDAIAAVPGMPDGSLVQRKVTELAGEMSIRAFLAADRPFWNVVLCGAIRSAYEQFPTVWDLLIGASPEYFVNTTRPRRFKDVLAMDTAIRETFAASAAQEVIGPGASRDYMATSHAIQLVTDAVAIFERPTHEFVRCALRALYQALSYMKFESATERDSQAEQFRVQLALKYYKERGKLELYF